MNQIGDTPPLVTGFKEISQITTTPACSETNTSSSVSVIKKNYPWVDELLQAKIWQESLSFSFDSSAKVL